MEKQGKNKEKTRNQNIGDDIEMIASKSWSTEQPTATHDWSTFSFEKESRALSVQLMYSQTVLSNYTLKLYSQTVL